MPRGRRFTPLAVSTVLVAALAVTVPAVSAAAASAAPGAPGAPSYFDLARKDCLGTAANTGSKVWYTVADGVLSDVYEPTIDNTDVSTLQYVVTDGATFTDLQTRDMTYTVAADPTGMACTVTSTDAAARLPAGHHLPHRPGPGHRAHEHPAGEPARAPARTWPGCTCTHGSTLTSTATAAAAATTPGANSGVVTPRARSRWSSAPTPSPTRPTGTTRCRPTWRWREPGRAGRERRLRGHRQRRPDPARPRARPDRLRLGTDGHIVATSEVSSPGHPGPGLRPHAGAVAVGGRGLAEPPVRPDRSRRTGAAGPGTTRVCGRRPPEACAAPTTCRPTC